MSAAVVVVVVSGRVIKNVFSTGSESGNGALVVVIVGGGCGCGCGGHFGGCAGGRSRIHARFFQIFARDDV